VLGLLTAACGGDDKEDSSASTTTAPDDSGSPGGDASAAQVSLDDLCTQAKADGVTAPDGFAVNLVTDIGKVDDRTFNQYAYEGLKAASDCFGFDTSYIETASEADYAKNIDTSLQSKPDAIVTPTPTPSSSASTSSSRPTRRTTRASSTTRTRAATSPACSPPRCPRPARSAWSAVARTSRRWSSSSTATRPAPPR
jgi:hypothetical protein